MVRGTISINTSLLRNVEYVNETKQSVLDIMEQAEDQNFNNRQTLDFAKMMFRSVAIKYLCRAAKGLKSEISVLEKTQCN